MSEKKRKRNIGKHGFPTKRVAIDPSAQKSTRIKVKVADGSDEKLGPVIASTPGLNLPSDLLFDAYTKSNSSSSQPDLLLHSSTHPAIDYTARTSSADSSPSVDAHLAHYIAIFDPTTQSLRVVPARYVDLRSSLRRERVEMTMTKRQREEEEAARRRTFASQRNELGLEFGTTKAKRAIQSQTENAIISPSRPGGAPPRPPPSPPSPHDVPASSQQKRSQEQQQQPDTDDLAARAILRGMDTGGHDAPTREQMRAGVDAAKPRPTPDVAAQSPADVYPPARLVGGADVLQQIPVHDWLAAEDVRLHSRFVARRLAALSKVARDGGKQASDAVLKLRLLRYLGLLMEFYGCLKPARDGAKRLPAKEEWKAGVGGVVSEKAPGEWADKAKRRFSEKGLVSKWNVDNLITHMCALAVTIDNFAADVFDLREDLRLDNKQISQYFHEIGCKVANPTEEERKRSGFLKADTINHRVARLKLPLDFPKQRVTSRRR
ncbi:RNA polymerase I associated factor, A49-like protein [Lineolata rhizophorae]|uniref:RNA polymerase I associated factor, A49-like protein n=1 Tax=Lineolata rhizophorae TaxID=578093 RepID=A0A6A6NZV7_9PEZI|nr:RNA polymerase I associated factor, A49-like protein [Lineolata rhizophorae]